MNGNGYTFLELLAFTAVNSAIVFPAFAIGLFDGAKEISRSAWIIILLLALFFLIAWAFMYAKDPSREYLGIPLTIGGVLIASNLGGLILLWTKPLSKMAIPNPLYRFFAMWITPVFLLTLAAFQFGWV